MSTTKAFTLIEALMIVAIIGILTLVGLGSYRNIVREARNKTVRSTLEIVRLAISKYQSGENAAGRFPGRPPIEQVRDILDQPNQPKIMPNGDLPDNPFAIVWVSPPSQIPTLNPDGVISVGSLPEHRASIWLNTGWGYNNDTGVFWANSASNGGSPDCNSAPNYCSNAGCDLNNPTENCY